MTDDSNITPTGEELVDINEDLDAFSAELFGTNKEPKKEEKVEEVAEIEDDPLATDDDKDADEDETPTEDEVEEEAEEDKTPKPEPKPKSKIQKRIEKLLENERVANERANALEQRLAAIEASKKPEVVTSEASGLRDALPADAPNPDAVDKDGTPIYQLGEFDPKYIRDITKYSVTKELAEDRARVAQEAETARMAQAQQEIRDGWLSRVDAYEKEVPEVRENIEELVDTFKNIDPAYGEYLATVIMANEHGPEIMDYLSQNIGEAQKIVASGPTAAILALGRIEAKLETPKQEEKRDRKQSNAPAPPENRSRGSGAKVSTADDTDDLDAFERKFFKR